MWNSRCEPPHVRHVPASSKARGESEYRTRTILAPSHDIYPQLEKTAKLISESRPTTEPRAVLLVHDVGESRCAIMLQTDITKDEMSLRTNAEEVEILRHVVPEPAVLCSMLRLWNEGAEHEDSNC